MPSMPPVIDGLAHQHRVEPAAAALAARDGAEFVAAFAEALADLVVQLGGERAFADARGVGLGDAEHEADGARPEARARRRLAGDRVRRGDVRIGAVIDVEQRALRAFEQHALGPPCAPASSAAPDRRGDRAGPSARSRASCASQLVAHRLPSMPETAAQRVVMGEQALDLRFQRSRRPEIDDANRAPADLVLIGGADAAFGRADAACPSSTSRGRGRARDGAAGSARAFSATHQILGRHRDALARGSARFPRPAPRDRRRRRCR